MVLNLTIGVVTICYPFLVYFGLNKFEPRYFAIFLAALICLRGYAHISVKKNGQAKTPGTEPKDSIYSAGNHGVTLALLLTGIFFIGALLASNSRILLLLYPFIINMIFLSAFSLSLLRPPSIIERLARRQDPDLPVAAIQYTRKVTITWCLLFMFNGCVALITAVLGDLALWTLFNGFIAYILISLVFVVEYSIRTILKGRFHSQDSPL